MAALAAWSRHPRSNRDHHAIRIYRQIPLGRFAKCPRNAWRAETYATHEKAHGPDEKVVRLVEMGFDAESATAALFRANGDEQGALEVLLGGG